MDLKEILVVVETFAERCRKRALAAQPGNPFGFDQAMRTEIHLLKEELKKQPSKPEPATYLRYELLRA